MRISTLSLVSATALQRKGWFLPLLAVGVLAAIAGALTIGRYPLGLADLWDFILASVGACAIEAGRFDLLHNLIVEIRLPRVLLAALIGTALSVSGTAYQAVFRNPLASPETLGALAGAAFGAALGMLVSPHWATVQLLAFVMGLAAVGFGLIIANAFGGASITLLVLGGIISGAFFTALLSFVKYAADPYNQLPAIVYWLMGSLGNASLKQIAWGAPPILLGVALLTVLGRATDALSMGDDEARAMGLPVAWLRQGVLIIATYEAALSVSLAGRIEWVGLIVPHLARLLVGPSNTRLIPAAALLGAIFMLLVDALSRTMMATEIPVGILTELIGVAAFVIVLTRARKGWT